MRTNRFYYLSRAGLALVILISGIAMIPVAGLSRQDLNWRLFANVYEPDVNVNHNAGAPGSAFLFSGSGFPPNAIITIMRDGLPVGSASSDATGQFQVLVQTYNFNQEGRYFITFAAGDNSADTKDFVLDAAEPLWPPPGDYEGETVDLTEVSHRYFPVVISR